MKWQRRIFGFIVLIVFPLLFGVGLYVLIPRWGAGDSAAFIGMLFLYLLIMFGKVTYEPSKIRQISMTEIPEDIRSIIITTTSKGDYINKKLIQAIRFGEKMSQTDLYKEVTKQGIELTPPAVREYIISLERAGLISSPSTIYEKEYNLTEKGRWCLAVVNQLFPTRYWLYVLRNELEIRSIPKFPQSSQQNGDA